MSIPVQPSGEDGVVHDHDGINGKLWKGRNVWEGGDRDDTMENVAIALIILIINYHSISSSLLSFLIARFERAAYSTNPNFRKRRDTDNCAPGFVATPRR